ncbi:MAG: SAM-dependent chlorinase/fluorinase, partial [Methanothrix sp.]
MKIITLITDFGSFYPAQMKGVILSRMGENAGDVTFVDIAHDIPPQDVRAGAFALLSSARYFPPGTIHIGVVDPGVGTDRQGLVVESGGQIFVGPDNGLLLPAAKSLGTPANPTQAYRIVISHEALGSTPVSSTFHGRDVFAPVAALL